MPKILQYVNISICLWRIEQKISTVPYTWLLQKYVIIIICPLDTGMMNDDPDRNDLLSTDCRPTQCKILPLWSIISCNPSCGVTMWWWIIMLISLEFCAMKEYHVDIRHCISLWRTQKMFTYHILAWVHLHILPGSMKSQGVHVLFNSLHAGLFQWLQRSIHNPGTTIYVICTKKPIPCLLMLRRR